MKKGKISEISYRRSVLKKLTNKIEGIRPGVDATAMLLEDVTLVMSSNCILKWFENCEEFYLQKTINQLCEKGGIAQFVQLQINIPENFQEKSLGKIINRFDDICEERKLIINQCRVYTGEVNDIVIHITVLGSTKYNLNSDNIKVGMDVVMAKSIGIGGAAVLADKYEEKLREKFVPSFVKKCLELKQNIGIENVAGVALENDVVYMHTVSDGGVFGAIWEVASVQDLGISVNVKDIPVWQEVIEISEIFDINPYLLEGTGSLLIVCHEGTKIVEELEKIGISANVIGTITDNKDKIAINGDEVRYLEPPRGDEIYKFI